MKIGNWPLFLLALEHIIRHPDRYHQANWRSSCGTYRCLAGWIAHFGGYRDVAVGTRFYGVRLEGLTSDDDIVEIEEAALTALELDPEVYGVSFGSDVNSAEADELAMDLFSGNSDMTQILTVVRDLARADGVTPTPLILDQMLELGVVSKWDTF